jgi:hypothetical protein
MNRALTSLPLPLPRMLRDTGWAMLLIPVVLLVITIFGRAIPWGVAAAVAAAAALLAPVVAADIAAAGVVCLGIYFTVLSGWMAFFHLTQDSDSLSRGSGLVGVNPVSNVFITGSGAGVILDVAVSALVLGFGVWLVPRTIGVHAGLVQRNVALTSRVERLAETRVAATDNAAAELRRVERDLHRRGTARGPGGQAAGARPAGPGAIPVRRATVRTRVARRPGRRGRLPAQGPGVHRQPVR